VRTIRRMVLPLAAFLALAVVSACGLPLALRLPGPLGRPGVVSPE